MSLYDRFLSNKFPQHVACSACVLCSYCSIEINRKKLKGTQKITIENFLIKEKLLSGQQMMSSHFVLKRKQYDNKDGGKSSEPKTIRKDSKEPFIEEDEYEDKTYSCYRNLFL